MSSLAGDRAVTASIHWCTVPQVPHDAAHYCRLFGAEATASGALLGAPTCKPIALLAQQRGRQGKTHGAVEIAKMLRLGPLAVAGRIPLRVTRWQPTNGFFASRRALLPAAPIASRT